jgi:hypothetical protein
MALNIFISSVYREFVTERRALDDQIRKLQDLFVGMEVFGSDPEKPADYCVRRVKESDLYVGIIGNDYGSIDKASGLSFTQLEYDAAVAAHVPCLIYFKASTDEVTDDRLSRFRQQLRTDRVVHPFKDINDLQLQFLIDLIKLLKGELFEKLVPAKRAAIPADALISLTRSFIQEQIKSVGQDKYISDVYIARAAERGIERFTSFESQFRSRVSHHMATLRSIAANYRLGQVAESASAHFEQSSEKMDQDTLSPALEDLKRAFHFGEVEFAVEEINVLLAENSQTRFESGTKSLQTRLRSKPWVDQVRWKDVAHDMSVERRGSIARQAALSNVSYRMLLQLFPSDGTGENILLANDILKELAQLVELSLKRCLVLVDKAGTGKTNVVCHMAEQLSRKHAVILLSGQIELSSEYDIEFHIQQRLESAFSGLFSDWLNRVSPSLQESLNWLFIIIDGINENNRRPLFIQMLKGFLPRLEGKRIKLILSCRDLFWDVFSDTLKPYLFNSVIPLHEFNEDEWPLAVELYFRKFNVDCQPDRDAKEALRNPLLLRFFCEANRDRKLGRLTDLRLVSVFDLYVQRTGLRLSERHSSLQTNSMLSLLLSLAQQMWQERSVSVSYSTVERDRDKAAVYDMVLSENIVLEEARHVYSTRRQIRFLYDEFMEYMIARSWIEQISESSNTHALTSQILQEAAESLGTFPSALGAVLFLDKMMESRGGLVNEFIKRASRLGDGFLDSQQTSLVYAFESMDFEAVDDELIGVVQKFDPIVREDLRERFAAVVLKLLERRPDHEYARKYVHQVLEVGDPNETDLNPLRYSDWPAANDPIAHSTKNQSASDSNMSYEEKLKQLTRLPPSRYHYSEETKINAIGILVQVKDIKEYGLIEEGIRRLGLTDLHSALQALEYLDLGSETLIFETIAKYVEVVQPEYRIYCAWLLRERYGTEPARYLTRLLADRETRVHEYTYRLFERRRTEEELIRQILRTVTDEAEIKPWHLRHFVRLLGSTTSFDSGDIVAKLGSQIVTTLMGLVTGHQSPAVRLDVYRALVKYPEYSSQLAVKSLMEKDKDDYIRKLASKISTVP